MKKIILVFVLLFGILKIGYGQNFFTESVMKDLEKKYADIENSGEYNLSIYNLLDDCHISNCPKQPEVAIYSMRNFSSISYQHLILKNGDKYEIIEMNGWNWKKRPFQTIMEDLVDYFIRNLELPRDLFLRYTEAALKVYNDNMEQG